ncbi:hypothetical protein LTR56_005078 [Elasticomyces elasticus]|nr:hypothetical protein LTR56_005078 [Elasticomyces elasticus]KAK5752103.1 hypothetical protein LTS12_017866 [Elasticomyces elasticus]
MPAEFGHDSLNERLQQRLPPLKEQARIIDYLKHLANEERLESVGIATGSLLDHGLWSGNLGFDLKWQSATLHGRGSERFAASSTQWVGRVVAAAVAQWDEVKNQYLHAAGLVTTSNEVLHCLEQSTGQQWEAGRGDVEDCVREAESRTERGFPDAAMFLMERSVLYDENLNAVGLFMTRDVKKMLHLVPEKVADIVGSAVSAAALETKHDGKDIEDAISGTETDAPSKIPVHEGDAQWSTRLPDGTKQVWLPPRKSKGKYLGGGVSGIVELLPNGTIVKSPWGGEEEADCRKDLNQEAEIYSQLHNAFSEHHRFVRFISFDEEQSELILQYMPNGTLRDYLKDHGGEITRLERLKWVSSAAEGLDMLHSLQIIHCDFSPKNFLLDAALDLKVADFGCSAFVGKQSSGCGSCRFYPSKD